MSNEISLTFGALIINIKYGKNSRSNVSSRYSLRRSMLHSWWKRDHGVLESGRRQDILEPSRVITW